MIIRRWYVFFVAILLGVLLAYFLPQYKQTEFYASMQLRTASVSPSEYVNKLLILGRQDSSHWKEELQLSDEAVQEINAIWPHYLYYNTPERTSYSVDYYDQYFSNPTYPLVNNSFCIEIKTTSEEYLDEYTEALYNYLSKDEYLNSLITQENYKIKSKLEFVKKELSTIENLRQQQKKSDIDLSSCTIDKRLLSDSDNPEVYHRLLSSLNDQAIALESSLNESQSPLSLISPMILKRDVVTSPAPSVTKSVTLFFLIAFVLTFIIDFRKELVAFSKKHLS